MLSEKSLNKRAILKKNVSYHSCLCSRCQFSRTKICPRWVNKCKVGEIVNLSLRAIFAEMEHETNAENECRKIYLLLLSLVGIESLVTHIAADRIPSAPGTCMNYDCEYAGPLVHKALTSADISESVPTIAIPLSL